MTFVLLDWTVDYIDADNEDLWLCIKQQLIAVTEGWA